MCQRAYPLEVWREAYLSYVLCGCDALGAPAWAFHVGLALVMAGLTSLDRLRS